MDHTNVAYGQTATSHWLASPLLWLFFVLGVIAWTIIAVGIVLEKADTMDRSERIAQLYGYTVCLIAIIVLIFSANDLISSAFEYANPLASGAYGYGYNGQNLTSLPRPTRRPTKSRRLARSVRQRCQIAICERNMRRYAMRTSPPRASTPHAR